MQHQGAPGRPNCNTSALLPGRTVAPASALLRPSHLLSSALARLNCRSSALLRPSRLLSSALARRIAAAARYYRPAEPISRALLPPSRSRARSVRSTAAALLLPGQTFLPHDSLTKLLCQQRIQEHKHEIN